jgi:hypothetical protein
MMTRVVEQHNRDNDVDFLNMIEEVTIEEGKYTKPPYLKGSVEEHIAYTYSVGTAETRPDRRIMCIIL